MNAPAPSVSRFAMIVEGVPRGLKPVDILGVLMYGLKPVPFAQGRSLVSTGGMAGMGERPAAKAGFMERTHSGA